MVPLGSPVEIYGSPRCIATGADLYTRARDTVGVAPRTPFCRLGATSERQPIAVKTETEMLAISWNPLLRNRFLIRRKTGNGAKPMVGADPSVALQNAVRSV